jgi:hypothetical protein
MDRQSDICIDWADEEILTSTASDETLEAAAGTEKRGQRLTSTTEWFLCC